MTSPDVVTNRRDVQWALGPDRAWIRLVRLAVGLFALAAVAYSTWRAATGEDRSLVEHFSLFTIEANLALGLTLILSALTRRERLPRWWDHLRGALAFYLVMTGIVYALLVAPAGEFWSWNIEWTNLALHRVTPLFAIADWLLVSMTSRGHWWRPIAWLIYPVVYLLYSWLRGTFTGWYPYDFLNPTLPGGWVEVLQITGIVLVAFLAVAAVLHVVGNLRAQLTTPAGRVPVRSSA